MINGKTSTCGVIGNPIEHTLSPFIHNTLAELHGENLVYVPFLVRQAGLEAALRGAYELGLLGLNVTVPYKSDVIPHLAEVDALAARIGAVNTLVRTDSGWKGYNTDMTGLGRALLTEGISLSGETNVILGAGGAARAVAYLCADRGAERVYLLNRTLARAEQVAAEVNTAFGRDVICPMLLSAYTDLPKEQFLVIQATNVGLAPGAHQAVIEDPAFYKNVHTGFDVIYKPFTTRFMELVRENGGQAYNGLSMLLYQGIEAYELWNETSIPEEMAKTVYEKLRNAMEDK